MEFSAVFLGLAPTHETTTLQNEDGQQLPLYTTQDQGDFYSLVDPTDLPLTSFPADVDLEAAQGYPVRVLQTSHRSQLHAQIISTFYGAVHDGNAEIVRDFVSRGLVSPDVAFFNDTPLLAAVRAGNENIPMISTIISLGAQVNKFGSTVEAPSTVHWYSREIVFGPDRTPLQLAAEKGHLAIVKILVKDYGADDALIAPDGALALRLAAKNGHREIVQFLPTRRGGGWRRWKTAHAKEIAKFRKAIRNVGEFLKFFVWDCPKFLVYTTPKEMSKYIIKNGHKFPAWCKRQIVKLPDRTRRLARHLWAATKMIPETIRDVSQWLWKELILFIKAVPRVMGICFQWLWNGLKATGAALGRALEALASLIHTVLSSVISFFQRITLKDIGRGIVRFCQALAVDFPRAVWNFILSSGKMTYRVLKGLFGVLGEIAWYAARGIFSLVIYVPRQLGHAIMALIRSMRHGIEEFVIFLHPKSVS